MAHALTIDDDVVLARAQTLAKRLGKPVEGVVSDALILLERSLPAEPEFSPEEVERRYQALRKLSKEFSRHAKPGATSDHRDMYDEFGLPK